MSRSCLILLLYHCYVVAESSGLCRQSHTEVMLDEYATMRGKAQVGFLSADPPCRVHVSTLQPHWLRAIVRGLSICLSMDSGKLPAAGGDITSILLDYGPSPHVTPATMFQFHGLTSTFLTSEPALDGECRTQSGAPFIRDPGIRSLPVSDISDTIICSMEPGLIRGSRYNLTWSYSRVGCLPHVFYPAPTFLSPSLIAHLMRLVSSQKTTRGSSRANSVRLG